MKSIFKTVGSITLIFIQAGCSQSSTSAIESLYATSNSHPESSKSFNLETSSTPIHFTFNGFGDSGWSNSHASLPRYNGGFKKAYLRFDPKRSLTGDLNYINWETSIGLKCNQFWAPKSSSTFAFLTHPQDLTDAISLGFNLIGLANNHSFDCLRSPEGNGPLQTIYHINKIATSQSASHIKTLFSGVALNLNSQIAQSEIKLSTGQRLPVSFVSAYVGGDNHHCKFILCDKNLAQLRPQLAKAKGFRLIALHSWDPSSHARLKSILTQWLNAGAADVAIGTGPHIAEKVTIIPTSKGNKILATSLGNFIHSSLSSQTNNIILQSAWSYNPRSFALRLDTVATTQVSCDGSVCNQGPKKLILK